MPSHRVIGKNGEDRAASFLQQQGITLLERNYVYQHGEIDIIGKDGSEIVFVEVKVRRTTAFGSPEDAVTPEKQALIRRTAEGYVLEHTLSNIPCRFDVVAIEKENGSEVVRYYKNAF